MAASKGSVGAVVRALAEGRSFVLPLHMAPDGDSVGSSVALALGLHRLGKHAVVVSKDPVPPLFDRMPGVDGIIPLSKWNGKADTAVFLDASDPLRAGFIEDMLIGIKTVNVDHHLAEGFGEAKYIDSTAASCAELVYEILLELGVALDKQIASLLYLGIMTDTGSFRFDNTSGRCFELASRLVTAGACPSRIARQVYETRRLESLKLLGLALQGLCVSECGMVCWTKITRQMLEETGATDDEAEGIVNYTRMPKGVEVGAIFKEMANGSVRVGLRSKDFLDVSKVAHRYGGGGHARASGFTVNAALEEATSQVIAHLSLAIREMA